MADAPVTERWPCGLATTPRMSIWRPSPDLAPLVSGYHLYAVDDNGGRANRGAFEPAWASLRITISGGEDWRVRSISGQWQRPGPCALFGPSSRLLWSESSAGILIGVGIRPRGWLRLFGRRARELADRIDPAPRLAHLDRGAIVARFRGLGSDDDVRERLEEVLRLALRPPPPDDAAIARIEAALTDPAIATVIDLSMRTGLSPRKLQRIADGAFGFPPKVLLRRARFLRSLHALRAARRGEAAAVIDPHYTDHSHFIRDSHGFLGMSPQAFLEIDMPLMRRSLELRREVLGAPAQALDPVVMEPRDLP
ncbi:MAG: helix-turn-helix domain-containing protein [Cypionkella sp.]